MHLFRPMPTALTAVALTACMGSKQPMETPQIATLEPCPEQSLSPDEVEALAKAGDEAIEKDRMGEHMSMQSLETGLPMLKKAAHHGHAEAMGRYAGIVNWYGFVDTDGGSFMGRTVWENAEEGMLYLLIATHLKGTYDPLMEHHFRVLMDPSIPYPEGFFENSYGFGWMLHHWTAERLEPIRLQAFHWKDCWGKRPIPTMG